MVPEVQRQKQAIEALCRKFGVRHLELFGSASTGERDGVYRDLDFAVEFDDSAYEGYADRYFGLLEALRDLFDRPVDLVVISAIRNPYFRESLERTGVLLYAA